MEFSVYEKTSVTEDLFMNQNAFFLISAKIFREFVRISRITARQLKLQN